MFTESETDSPLQWIFFSRSFGWLVNYWKQIHSFTVPRFGGRQCFSNHLLYSDSKNKL